MRQKLLFVFVFSLLSIFAFSLSANAQDDCNAKELKEFDFLLGDWKQKENSGTLQITKILDGCGIQEVWELEGFNAVLLRTYDSKTKKWYLTFTAHDLVPQVWEGRKENGVWIFYRDWELNGKPRRSRTFWTKDADGSFTRFVEQLNDDGKTWRPHVKDSYQNLNTKKEKKR